MRKLHILALTALLLPVWAGAHGGVDDEELIIRMTKNGFEPKELTVVEGDEVLFINNDDADRWPASNFHPTHEIYPEFDTKGNVKPGQSWKMKFENVGTWRMHDHLFPHMTGTIVVLEDPDKIATTSQAIGAPATGENAGFWHKLTAFFTNLFKKKLAKADKVDQAALSEFKSLEPQAKYSWLEERAELENPETAWKYVVAAYNTPEGVVGSPHDMAHLVGQLIFRKYGLGGLPICTPVFAFGCYHGLMEVAFDKDHPEKFVTTILDAQRGCQELGDENNPSYWSCIHGMGHGVITYEEHDTGKALNDCDLLTERVRTYCYDGVFMELSISAAANFYKRTNPLYPCNAIGDQYRSGCARAQARVMQTRLGLPLPAVAQACRESGDETIRYHCIDALGYGAAQSHLTSSIAISAECDKIANKDDAAQCKAAAAGELVFQNAANWQVLAPHVCDTLSANYKHKGACDTRIAQVKQSYGR